MTFLQTALAGCLVALVVVGVFMALDKAYLHWYVDEDRASQMTALDADIADLQTRVGQAEKDLIDNSSADAEMSTGFRKFELDYLPLFDDIAKKLSCAIRVPMGPPRELVCP
jgi:hypothetical protein